MARGRMLNKTISASMKFHQLSDDTCRLTATWIIPHLDKNGVYYGEPSLVRSYVFPMRDDITTEQVESYLLELEVIGLMRRFAANGRTYQHWPGFDENQVGLRKDREGTDFPNPPVEPGIIAGGLPEDCRIDDDNHPAEVKSSEVKSKFKGSEEKDAAANAAPASPTPAPEPKAEPDNGKPPPTEHQAMFTMLCGAMKFDAALLTAKQRGRINRLSKRIPDAGKTPRDVFAAGQWWWAEDWRGKKGDTPTDSQLFEVLGKLAQKQTGLQDLEVYQ